MPPAALVEDSRLRFAGVRDRATIPLVLRRLGADPATASSIFLTTAIDVASMGIFLGLATAFIVYPWFLIPRVPKVAGGL